MKEREEKLRIEDENRQKYFQEKTNRELNMTRTKKAIKKAKRQEFKVGKNMTLQNDMFKKEFMDTVKKQNQQRKERIREEEEHRAEKLRYLEEMKKKENQDFYKTRVDDERDKIMDNEKKIKKMEKLEAELLSRLKNSQQMEQSEYTRLEEVLKESNEACEQRKKNQVMIRKPRPKEIQKATRGSVSIHDSKSLSNA